MSQMLLNSPAISASADAAALQRIIEGKMKDLPTLPILVAKILQTASSPTASARDLQALIALDAGLTAKVLRLANSSFYGQQRRITTLGDAVVILGSNTIRNLTLSASMLDSLQPRGAARVFDWRAYWEHCNGVALCARRLARRQGLPGPAVEEAFVAGLLHDIGKLFLGKYCPDLLAEVVLTSDTFRIPMVDAEWRLMSTTHALLGQQIAEQWSFPPGLCSAIGAHHDPESWRDDPTLTYLVHAADVLTQQAGIGARDATTLRLHRDVDDWLHLTSVEREDLLEQVTDEMVKTQKLLGWEDEDAATAAGGEDFALPGQASGGGGTPPPGPEPTPQERVHSRALAIASVNTLSEIETLLTAGAKSLLPLWGSALFLWDDDAARFVPGAGSEGELLTRIGEQQMRESLLDRALSARAPSPRPVTVDGPRSLKALADGHRFLLCPLADGRKTVGFLLMGQSASAEPPSPQAAEDMATLAAYATSGIVRVQSFRTSVAALSAAIDARDPNGAGHSQRVRDMAEACGRALGLSDARVETLGVAALLHDVGKISIPDRILNKPGQLDPDEFDSVAGHAASGAHLAGHTFGAVMPFILCHHERWDGQGYPAGLQGAQIPVEAQIIAVCEAWDVMRTGQTYRGALSAEAAREELRQGSGTQFNPAVVEAFLAPDPVAQEAQARPATVPVKYEGART